MVVMNKMPPKTEKYHILVVDDDHKLRSLLVEYLDGQEDILATSVEDADSALRVVKHISIDLMILDVMMPVKTGIELLAELRKFGYNFPVIMLSALADIEDKIKGLEAGADDYISKPFSPAELLLRIKTVLKRFYKTENKDRFNDNDTFVFGEDFSFDFATKILHKGDEKIDLSSSDSALLACFIKNRETILSREDIAEQLGLSDSIRAVDVQVTRLRKKIEMNPKKSTFILTIRNKGYKFIGY